MCNKLKFNRAIVVPARCQSSRDLLDIHTQLKSVEYSNLNGHMNVSVPGLHMVLGLEVNLAPYAKNHSVFSGNATIERVSFLHEGRSYHARYNNIKNQVAEAIDGKVRLNVSVLDGRLNISLIPTDGFTPDVVSKLKRVKENLINQYNEEKQYA